MPGRRAHVNVGSVHNAYIQVAAEEGLIGLLTLVVVALIIRRRVRSLRAHTRDPAILATLRWATLVLIVVLIWWNDNPLYGAQPETLSFALALGTLAVPWSSLRADSQSSLGEGRPIRLSARAEGRDLVPYGRTGQALRLRLFGPGNPRRSRSRLGWLKEMRSRLRGRFRLPIWSASAHRASSHRTSAMVSVCS